MTRCATRPASSSPTRSGCGPGPSSRSTTCASSAAARPAWPPPSTRRPRGCAPSWSSATPPAARPARAPPSRTTSASPRASRAPTSPTGRWRRPSRFGAETVLAREVVGLEQRGPVHAVRFADGGEVESRAVLVATGVAYRRLEAARRRRRWARAGSTTAPRRARRRSAPDQVVLRRRGGELRRPGGAQLRQGRQPGRHARARAPASRTPCRSTSSPGSQAADNVEVRFRTEVVAAHGTDHLESVTLADRDTGAETDEADQLAVRLHRRPPPHRLAGRRRRPRRARGSSSPVPTCSCPSTPGGGRSRGPRTPSRRASPGCSPPATCGWTR